MQVSKKEVTEKNSWTIFYFQNFKSIKVHFRDNNKVASKTIKKIWCKKVKNATEMIDWNMKPFIWLIETFGKDQSEIWSSLNIISALLFLVNTYTFATPVQVWEISVKTVQPVTHLRHLFLNEREVVLGTIRVMIKLVVKRIL